MKPELVSLSLGSRFYRERRL